MNNVLTYMTFVPVAGAAIVLALPNNAKLIRWVSAAATVPPLLMAIWLFKNFDRANPGFQFIEDYTWIPSYNISYTMGIDGLSISMVLLTALLSFLCIFASFGIEKAVKGYFALFLLLDAGMMGVFCALDFFPFLCFLGSHAVADVFFDRHLGRAAPRICCDKIFLVHVVWQRSHAARDPRALF
jgi:NADH-quinone oxidoreductase subunit M